MNIDKLKKLKMPEVSAPREASDEDELLLGMEDDTESEETASPLADFSDEDILAEARARGLSLEQEQEQELELEEMDV